MKAKVPEMITLASHHERVEYLDMVVLMALHNTFGFGPERLRRFYDAIVTMDAHYRNYNGNNEPLFGRKDKRGMGRMDLYAVRRDLAAIGVDYDAWVAEDEAKGGEKT
jgi:hypothetical protein